MRSATKITTPAFRFLLQVEAISIKLSDCYQVDLVESPSHLSVHVLAEGDKRTECN